MKNTLTSSLIILATYLSLSACHLFYPIENGLRYDPIERDSEYKKSIIEVNKKIKDRKVCQESDGQLGAVHCIWSYQKIFLKEEYNINWKTPSELNPDVIFD